MEIKIKRDNKKIDRNKYLLNSEKRKWKTINLSKDTSKEYRRDRRTKRKLNRVNDMQKFVWVIFLIIAIYAIIIWIVGRNEINKAKEILLPTVKTVNATVIPKEDYEQIKVDLKESAYLNKLFTFISKWEWAFQYKAFCDSYHRTKYWLIRQKWKQCRRWSIWYWTKSYRGETITYAEWIKRRNDDVKQRNSLITSTCLTDNQRIATIDFLYQHWVNSRKVKHYANTCQTTKIYNTIVWLRDYYKNGRKYWLVKREQMRINRFYK